LRALDAEVADPKRAGVTEREGRRARLSVPLAASAALVLVAALVAAFLIARAPGDRSSPSRAAAAASGPAAVASLGAGQAEVSIGAHERVTPIPHSFLGFSTEYWTLPVDERHLALYRRVLSQIHVAGDGRFVLRIGGDSSDHAVWDPTSSRLPPWAFEVTPRLVARTAKIIRQMRLRVIIDINTLTSTPRLAADWARAAQAHLPARSITGFEIGNEPDLYSRRTWARQLAHTGFNLARLPRAITPTSYVGDYNRFARALIRAAPGVPLLAPALANPDRDVNWISTLLAAAHPGLRVISVHRYPYSACSRPGRPQYPTVQKLLGQQATAGMARSVKPAVALGRRVGLPVRLTEINSVTCGGVPRVSNTFATALWAPDALFELVRAGVEGVNLHVRVFSINAPFRFDRRGVRAWPLLYGLILFKRMLGPHSRLVPVRLRSPRSLRLKAWAVRVGSDTLNVLLLDKGERPAAVALDLPATGSASVQRLVAPSASSRSHVTLAGQHLDDRVIWAGRARVEAVSPAGGRYSVSVRRQSAALLTVHVARTTLSGP
jgi:hypothetical protein